MTDETERALADNYTALARAVIALAAADLVAVRHPRTMHEYTERWLKREYNGHMKSEYLTDGAMMHWCRDRERELVAYFHNGGGELAQAAECYHYVRLALERPVLSSYRLKRAAKRMRMERGRG